MRAVGVLVLVPLLAGCSVVLRLDVQRAASAAPPSAVPVAPPPAAGSSVLGGLLTQYRDELERDCATGVLAAETCQFQRNRFLDLLHAHATGHPEDSAAEALAAAAEATPDPGAERRLTLLAREIGRAHV